MIFMSRSNDGHFALYHVCIVECCTYKLWSVMTRVARMENFATARKLLIEIIGAPIEISAAISVSDSL